MRKALLPATLLRSDNGALFPIGERAYKLAEAVVKVTSLFMHPRKAAQAASVGKATDLLINQRFEGIESCLLAVPKNNCSTRLAFSGESAFRPAHGPSGHL